MLQKFTSTSEGKLYYLLSGVLDCQHCLEKPVKGEIVL